ncbi:MAG TPA: hypothetical protein ENJ53_03370 [Phaeodactylibacter sp.]|nr:hypothetical protein [Phaeodactylibacter sp.]
MVYVFVKIVKVLFFLKKTPICGQPAPSAICRPSSVVHRPSSTACRPSSAVHRPPSAVRRPSYGTIAQ